MRCGPYNYGEAARQPGICLMALFSVGGPYNAKGNDSPGRMRCGPYKEKEKETEGGEQTREFDYAQGVRYN